MAATRDEISRDPLRDAGARNAGSRNNAGRRHDVAPGKSMQVLEVDGTSDRATTMTVTLAQLSGPRNQGEGDTLLGVPPCRAIIEWGNDGAQTEIEVDWRNGAVLSLAAAMVKVTAVNLSDEQTASLAAFIAYGTWPGSSHNTYTIPVAADTTVEIPPFAKAVSVLWVDTGTVGDVVLSDENLNPICMIPLPTSPLPNNARFVTPEEACVLVFDLPV